MILKVWNFLKGKKTYIVAICGLVYGISTNNQQIVVTCLLAMGLRDGISTEISKLL